MSTSRCPLCSKCFPPTFLPLHAASCNLPPSHQIKKPRKSKSKSTLPLQPTSLPPPLPPGLYLYQNIFPPAQQLSLLNFIEQTPPHWVNYLHRRSKNYGPAYDLPNRRFLFGPTAPPQIPLPAYATDLVLPRLRALSPLLTSFEPNQLHVGLYLIPGGYILPHNDCENGRIATAVVGVCLKAACTMTFILRKKVSGLSRDVKRDIRLPSGAVYIMSGDALRIWEHAIFPKNTEATRISLTFRDVAPHPPGHPASSAKPKATTDENSKHFKQKLFFTTKPS